MGESEGRLRQWGGPGNSGAGLAGLLGAGLVATHSSGTSGSCFCSGSVRLVLSQLVRCCHFRWGHCPSVKWESWIHGLGAPSRMEGDRDHRDTDAQAASRAAMDTLRDLRMRSGTQSSHCSP